MSKEVRFTLNGRPVAIEPGAGRVPARRAARALRRPVDQGRLLAPGAVRLLPRPHRRPAARRPAPSRRGGPRAARCSRSRGSRRASARSSRRPSPPPAGVQCGFCIPGIALRAKHLLDQSPARAASEIARAIDGHLCRCTGYAQIVDAVELMARACGGRAALPEPAGDGGVGKPLARYRRAGPGSRRAALRGRPAPRGPAARRARPLRARAGPGGCASTPRRPRRFPACARSSPQRDVPGERWYGLLHDDWPGFVAEGEEVRCVGDVLAAVAADDARTARAAAALVAVEYEPLPAGPRPGRGARARRAPGQPEPPEPPLALGHPPRRRGGRARRERARRHRHLADPAHRAPVPRARGRARGAAAGRTPRPLHARARASSTTAGRSRASSASPRSSSHVELVPERRRLRRQGGHVGPGADGAPRARHAAGRSSSC